MYLTLPHPDLLFMLLGASWGVFEMLLGHRRRAADGGARDQGTLQLLWRVLYAAVALGVLLSLLGAWRYVPALQEQRRAGWAARCWPAAWRCGCGRSGCWRTGSPWT